MLSWIKRIFINRKTKHHERNIFSNALPINDTLDDESEWIRIVPVGVFPLHHNGPHEITAEHVKQMADNFNNSNTDLLFDYEHRSLWGDSLAAGWSGEVEARDDGLYAKYPAFTAKAQGHINDREYRYLSPTYWLDAMDKSGRDIGAVILHVGLTNTPYLDNEIDHIGNSNFSPGSENQSTDNDRRTDMKLTKENLAKFGLKEDATEDEINLAIANSAMVPVKEETEANQGDPSASAGKTPASDQNDKGDSKIAELEARLAAREAADLERTQKELTEKAELLVNSAVEKGKILPRDKAAYLNSATANYDKTKEILDEIKVNSVTPGSMKVNTGGEGDPKANSSQAFRDYIKPKMALAE